MIPPEATKTIDSSKIQDFLDCPRRYFYRHVLGWEKDEPAHALHFGTCVHTAMDALYSYGFNQNSVELAKAMFLDEYRPVFGEETDEIYFPKSPYMFFELLEHYYQQELPKQDRFETLYTEIAGSVPILHGHRLHFRIDRMCKDLTTGLIQVREYKTTSRRDRQWADQWLLSTQIGTYTHVLFSLYSPKLVDGVIVEGLVFQKKGVDLLPIGCRRTARQMLSWLSSTSRTCDRLQDELEILETIDTEGNDVMSSFPFNTQSCTKYFGCPYHPFCAAWSNPLQECQEVPAGFRVKFWDPTEKPAKKEFTL